MVLLKVSKIVKQCLYYIVFTFQYGSIKGLGKPLLSKVSSIFTFQYGSIKGSKSQASSHTYNRFTFQYGSIKGRLPILPPEILQLFTFQYGSIKGEGDFIFKAPLIVDLHSNMVLLKVEEEEYEKPLYPNLHSNMVLLKVTGSSVSSLIISSFTFQYGSIKGSKSFSITHCYR